MRVFQALGKELTKCPACNYGEILADKRTKIFRCKNPDCQRVTCRSCQAEAHIPLTCEENHSNDNAKRRRIIEEKMTESFLRTCPKCKSKFYKNEGCNKMTCKCGMTMCYLCKEPNIGYSHFGTVTGCALHTLNDNTNESNRQTGAILAAKELGMAKELHLDRDAVEEDEEDEIQLPILLDDDDDEPDMDWCRIV